MMDSSEKVAGKITSYSHTRKPRPDWLRPGARRGAWRWPAALAAALGAGGLTLLSQGTPGLRPTAEFAFPVAAADVQALVVHGALAAVVTRSSMGERLLSIRRLADGAEVLERRPFGGGPIALDERHVAFSENREVTLIDLDTQGARAIWFGDPDSVAGLCLNDPTVTVLTHGSDHAWTLVTVRTDPAAAGSGSARPIASTTPPVMQCTAEGAILTITHPDNTRAAEVFAGSQTAAVELGAYEPLLTYRGYLYTRDSSGSVFRRRFEGDADWQRIYTHTDSAPVIAGSVDPAARRVVLVVTLASQGAAVVSFAPDGSQPSRVALPPDRQWADPRLWSVDGASVAALGRRDARPWVFAATYEHERPPAALADVAPVSATATDRALAWLERQLTPVGRTEKGDSRRLIDSYEDDKRVGWTYDAALAAIALTAWDRKEAAQELLTGLASLQQEDGSWAFAFDPDAAAALPGDRYVGSMAWVVMAANFYESRTGDRRFSGMANRGLAFIDRFVQRDVNHPAAGGVSMGPVAPQTYSAEHNADSYSAFVWRGRLDHREDLVTTAKGIRRFILTALAPDAAGSRAFFKVGERDDSLYLDPQTWTTLTLADPGEPDAVFRRALDIASQRLAASGALGTATGVNGLRDSASGDSRKVWSEGTEGMVAARLALGDIDAARAWHEQTMRLQSQSGGIPYATDNRENWTTQPSVAGTAWFLLNRTWPPTNPFVPDASSWMTRFGAGPRLVPAAKAD